MLFQNISFIGDVARIRYC